MYELEVGDTVQLTATVMLNMSDQRPDVFNAIKNAGRTGGPIISISGNQVEIDMGDAVSGPLAIEVDGDHPHLALQLVRKGNTEEVTGVYEADPAPDEQVIVQEAVADAGVLGALLHSARQGAAQGGMMGRVPASVLDQMRRQQREPDEVPIRVRTAQWVVSQIMGLKQYAIAQDLQRVSDEDAPMPEPGNEAEKWQAGDGKQFRPVMVDLSGTEEQLYNSALRTIQEWVTGQMEAPHPEVPAPAAQVPVPLGHIPTVIPQPVVISCTEGDNLADETALTPPTPPTPVEAVGPTGPSVTMPGAMGPTGPTAE